MRVSSISLSMNITTIISVSNIYFSSKPETFANVAPQGPDFHPVPACMIASLSQNRLLFSAVSPCRRFMTFRHPRC